VLRLVPFAYMPSLIPRQVEWNLFARTIPFASAFPESEAGRPLHCRFRGLLSVYSRYGLHAHRVAYATFYTEGFSSFVASAAASVATGWNEPAPGRDFPPAEDQGLFTAHSDLRDLLLFARGDGHTLSMLLNSAFVLPASKKTATPVTFPSLAWCIQAPTIFLHMATTRSK